MTPKDKTLLAKSTLDDETIRRIRRNMRRQDLRRALNYWAAALGITLAGIIIAILVLN